MVELHSSKFRVITTNNFGVRIFRKFTVEEIEIIIVFPTDAITFCNNNANCPVRNFILHYLTCFVLLTFACDESDSVAPE